MGGRSLSERWFTVAAGRAASIEGFLAGTGDRLAWMDASTRRSIQVDSARIGSPPQGRRDPESHLPD